jgi:hypothetical protein
LRIDYGSGYRVYFIQRGELLAVLLCGGDKRTREGLYKALSKDGNPSLGTVLRVLRALGLKFIPQVA